MNAAEARTKANENLPKVDAHFLIAKVSLNQAIKQSVNVGHFTTRRTLALPKYLENEVISQLEQHYKDLGYKVDVYDLFRHKIIQISWE